MFAWQGRETKECLTLGRAQHGHYPPQLNNRAGIATLFDHLIEASRAQARVLRERGADKVEIRISQGGARRSLSAKAIGPNYVAYSLRVEVELGRDGPDLPVLGEVEAANFGGLFGGDHKFTPGHKKG
jgi:hypothetical protein